MPTKRNVSRVLRCFVIPFPNFDVIFQPIMSVTVTPVRMEGCVESEAWGSTDVTVQRAGMETTVR